MRAYFIALILIAASFSGGMTDLDRTTVIVECENMGLKIAHLHLTQKDNVRFWNMRTPIRIATRGTTKPGRKNEKRKIATQTRKMAKIGQ